MTDKYQNKYRIQSARLQGYDYTRAGLYFITICTRNSDHYFGEIINNEMQLSNIGVLSNVFWHEIINHSKNIELHEFVIMPNHIHGILEIIDDVPGFCCRDDACIVSTTKTTTIKNQKMAKISPKSGSISRIVGSYKSAVSKHAHRLGYEFEWQTRFHDHIIRNEKEFIHISKYIRNNPTVWNDDKFNKS